MFEYSAASIMASRDGTLVDIDKDGDNIYEITGIALDQGETYLIDDEGVGLALGGGIRSNAGHPIQVNMMTADVCAGYESRTYPLIPYEQWDNSYYVPVGTPTVNPGLPANDDAPTTISLYNPDRTASLTVSYQFTGSGISTVTVPANGAANITMT